MQFFLLSLYTSGWIKRTLKQRKGVREIEQIPINSATFPFTRGFTSQIVEILRRHIRTSFQPNIIIGKMIASAKEKNELEN